MVGYRNLGNSVNIFKTRFPARSDSEEGDWMYQFTFSQKF